MIASHRPAGARWIAGELVARLGPRLGLQVELEPAYGYVGQVVRPDGRRFYFRNTGFDLNGQGAAEVARDKAYTAYFLRQMGYPVPEGETFYSSAWCRRIGSDRDVHAAYAYARQLGFPVIVKPNSKSHGAGVARVFNRRELYRAVRAVFTLAEDRVALVQRVAEGDDYRLVILDGEVPIAYRRLPLAVVGDGRATVEELLRRKQAELWRAGRDARVDPRDYLLQLRLRRLGLHLDSVPPQGARLVLRDAANLSGGGEAVDVTECLHPGFRALAARLARDMGLRYCGLDLLVRGSIEEPPRAYVVLELNPAPGLDHYARGGEVALRRVEALYERVLRALASL